MPSKRREKAVTNLTEHAYRSLKAMILAGEIPAAKPLVEREVCLRLGMSRTPVKHAFSRLRQEGLVKIVPRIGAFLMRPDYTDYQHLLSVREVLEGLAARLAVEYISNAKIRELREMFGRVKDLEDADSPGHEPYAMANVLFHREIHRLSHNPKLIETLQALYDHLNLIPLRTIELTGRRSKSAAEHEEIIKALEGRDPEQAECAMRAHLRSLKDDVGRFLREETDILEQKKW